MGGYRERYFQSRRACTHGRYDQTLASLGQEREEMDPATACPPEAPDRVAIDKEALLQDGLRKAGSR